jgi:hypothetical protein
MACLFDHMRGHGIYWRMQNQQCCSSVEREGTLGDRKRLRAGKQVLRGVSPSQFSFSEVGHDKLFYALETRRSQNQHDM